MFRFLPISKNGRESDGGVFNRSSLGQALDGTMLNLPPPKPLPGRTAPMPYVLVADDAFALRPNLLKPYPGRSNAVLPVTQQIFNYRLSRSRRTIENAFGIMSAQFRILRQPIRQDAAKSRKIVKAACALHNFKIDRKSTAYIPIGFVDSTNPKTGQIRTGNWRREVGEPSGSNFYELERTSQRDRQIGAVNVRDEFCAYFSAEGQVDWQLQAIAHTRN